MAIYSIHNGAMQTSAAPTKVATGTSLKTMLQLKLAATITGKIKEWGISFDGSTAATPGDIELLEVDGAATVTAYAAADITKVDAIALLAGDPTTAKIAVGTTSSGYTASGEGTITSTRNLDEPELIAGTNQFIHQFPLGEEPVIQPAKFVIIRCTFVISVNCRCWIKFEI